MATAASLGVSVVAKTGGLAAGMNRASGIINRFRKTLGRWGLPLIAAQQALNVISNVVRSLIAPLKQASQELGAMAESAQRIGISGEALSALSLGAAQSGMQLEALETNLLKMQRNLVAAAQGGGEAAAAFKRLGLDASALMALSPEKQLAYIADALAAFDKQIATGAVSAAEKISSVMTIFGQSGVKMIPMLQGGAAALAEMQSRAAKLGVVFTGLDLAKVDAMNDAFTSVYALFRSLARRMVVDIAPTIILLTRGLEQLIVLARNVGLALFRSFGGAMRGIVKLILRFDVGSLLAKYINPLFMGWNIQLAILEQEILKAMGPLAAVRAGGFGIGGLGRATTPAMIRGGEEALRIQHGATTARDFKELGKVMRAIYVLLGGTGKTTRGIEAEIKALTDSLKVATIG